jgi:PAS domain S-box-containing protein
MKKKIHILLLEDNEDDATLLDITLKKAGVDFTLDILCTREDFEGVNHSEYDLIISDYNLLAYNGSAALQFVRQKDNLLPFIILSGTLGDEQAVGLLHQGANDFVLKKSIGKIPLVIDRVLNERKLLSEKIRFQREILENNLILDTLFNNFTDVVSLTDNQERFVKVNRAFCEFFGFDASSVIGRTRAEVMDARMNRISIEMREAIKATKKPNEFDFDYVNSNGQRFVMSCVKSPIIEDGNITGIITVMRDITRQRAIEEQREKILHIQNQVEPITRSGSFEYNSEQDILICSQNLTKLMELDSNRLSLTRFAKLVKSEDRMFFISKISESVEHRLDFSMECRFQPTPGSYVRYYKVVLRPDYRAGQSQLFYGTLVDITEDRQLSTQLIEVQEKERTDIVRELHDNLGQKLSVSSMLLSSYLAEKPNSELQNVLTMLHESIDDLSQFMNRISIKAVEDHSLEYAVEQCLANMSGTGIEPEFQFELDERKISLFVKGQIFRVIQETMNNALKYSKASKFLVWIKSTGGIIDIMVSDNGKGFSAEKSGGNGLKNIEHRIKQCNGLMSVTSEQGQGTTFNIKIPID